MLPCLKYWQNRRLKIPFYKYHGTGNDFVIIDNRSAEYNLSDEQIVHICDRRFGIGSDGLILIQNHPTLDFEMVFYNPDASQSFCGNGSRCAVVFAKTLGLFNSETKFLSTDGEHEANLLENGWVSLRMHDVNEHEWIGNDLLLNTGSPHYLIQKKWDDSFDIVSEARAIRYNDRFAKEGVNVNYIHVKDDVLNIRTYERGVENETLSCGTGVTAAALGNHLFNKQGDGQFSTNIQSQGGRLKVKFNYHNGTFSDILLQGPAQFVFEGSVDV